MEVGSGDGGNGGITRVGSVMVAQSGGGCVVLLILQVVVRLRWLPWCR